MIYLDIVLLVNGAMDAFLLVYTAHLLRKKVRSLNIFLAVILGELPVFLILSGNSYLTIAAKIVIPAAMIKIGLNTKGLKDLAKGLLYFSLLAALGGGVYYALTGWLGLNAVDGGFLTLGTIWILPLIALLLTGGQVLWTKLQKTNLFFDNVLYDVELAVEGEKPLRVKALLDTGNELRDPLTGAPVMLLEEKTALEYLPEKVASFMRIPWRESANPWTYIWNDEEYARQKMFFISAGGVSGQTWLLGIRLSAMKISQGERQWEQPATVALVPRILSSENKYQALLHPDHIDKTVGKEEIA